MHGNIFIKNYMKKINNDNLIITAKALLKTTNVEEFKKSLSNKLKLWLFSLPIGIDATTLKSIIKLLLGFKITPHHINPLFGHIGNKPTFFPTGALPLSINSSSYNLKGLSHIDHVQAHRDLFQLEQGYSSYQSTIILRTQNDYLRK